MALSELGLTPAEVDAIMKDITGQPQLPGATAVAGPNTNSTVTTSGNMTGPAVKVSSTLPPALGPGGKSVRPTQKPKGSSGVAPAIVGATTGFIFGGPPGALVGAAGMWLLNKAITPK